LNGGCQVPIAAYAVERVGQLWLRALVGSADCGTLLKAEGLAPIDDAESLGIRVAEELISQGARELLAQAGL
jgi:hydroxymethylbilane synthase